MDWSNKYEVLVVDYKLIIRENIVYKRLMTALFMFSCCILTLLVPGGQYLEDKPVSFLVPLITVLVSFVIVLIEEPGPIIEIDQDKKAIKVRGKLDLKREDVLVIKIAREKRGGYFFDYLSLVTGSEKTPAVHHIFQMTTFRVGYKYDETSRIAGLIAETMGLTMVIER